MSGIKWIGEKYKTSSLLFMVNIYARKGKITKCTFYMCVSA